MEFDSMIVFEISSNRFTIIKRTGKNVGGSD